MPKHRMRKVELCPVNYAKDDCVPPPGDHSRDDSPPGDHGRDGHATMNIRKEARLPRWTMDATTYAVTFRLGKLEMGRL